MKPYVYKLTHKETGEFYIGVRYANKLQASDDLGVKYFSSSKVVKQKGFDNFNAEVIREFDNKNDALEYEATLISESWGSNLLLNRANKGAKFKNDTPRSDEFKRKLSELHKGKKREPFTDDHKKKIGDSNRGKTISNGRKPLSKSTKQRMHDAAKNKIYITNGDAVVRVHVSDVDVFLEENTDWYVGVPKKSCPHCDAIVDNGNFKRYHGDNCKHYSGM